MGGVTLRAGAALALLRPPRHAGIIDDKDAELVNDISRNLSKNSWSLPPCPQDEIKPHMRGIVVEWMLDVCVDQRCNVDVFLLATNIIDRFLSTIRLDYA